MTILLTPVRDPQAFARKIDFGTVRRINGRTISVVAHKVEGPPHNADAVTKALHRLKSPFFARRGEAARLLQKIVPNERREEVAQSLQEALMNDNDLFDLFTCLEIVEALAIWGTKENLPALEKIVAAEKSPFILRNKAKEAIETIQVRQPAAK